MAAGSAHFSWRSSTGPDESPRVGLLGPAARGNTDLIRDAGGEPLVLALSEASPGGGASLRREWVADQSEVSWSANGADALLVAGPCAPEDLVGFVLAALRLDLPMVVAHDDVAPFDVVPYALGLTPAGKSPFEVAVEVAHHGEPRVLQLVDNFSLANALRAGLSAGVGPELVVHLAAVAWEAGVSGFPRMTRVLAPESPAVASPAWLREHGPAALLAALGSAVHDVPTVAGRLKAGLPQAPPPPDVAAERLFFPRGRASGTQVVCQAGAATEEVSGECRVFASEKEAVRAVEEGDVGEGHLLVVAGCGVRGGPGLLALNGLARALAEAGVDVPVVTDGVAPNGLRAKAPWVSLFSPEAASGGAIGLLRDGDSLRFDLVEGRIRTGVSADALASREPFAPPDNHGFGYAARYARTALPPFEGAGFGL